ncbi:MAG: hypothetical protein GY708_04470 [Actinomycetia bacterium]|nr:hypothetical protein [Actinomycetes bacterium]MCP4962109.1 hypothetical protein [Actinomycetes bacterium]
MANDEQDGLVGEAKALAKLVQDYAKQETIGPLKGLGRYVAFGVAGSIFWAMGLVLLLLAGLRVLQTQTGSVLDGNWSFAPYLIMLVVAGIIIGLAGRAIVGDSETGMQEES